MMFCYGFLSINGYHEFLVLDPQNRGEAEFEELVAACAPIPMVIIKTLERFGYKIIAALSGDPEVLLAGL